MNYKQHVDNLNINIVESKPKGKGIIIIIQSVGLEIVKLGKVYQLLNQADHATFLRTHNKDPSRYRPDICHLALLNILDSPLNMSGNIKSIYIRTVTNLLIHIDPQVCLPRKLQKFSEVIIRLIKNGSIRATNTRSKLLKVVKGPVTKYFPTKCLKIGISPWSTDLVDPGCFIETIPSEISLAFIINMDNLNRNLISCDQYVSVSKYCLNTASCLSKLIYAIESRW